MLKRVTRNAILAIAPHLRISCLRSALLAACLQLLAACGGVNIEAPRRADARTPIRFSAEEDEHLRAGMRDYLESIKGIIAALPQNQMASVASNAKRAGMSMVNDVPISAVKDMPPGFVILSIDTHQKFDALSRLAEEPGSKSAALTMLSDILANCTACHSTYRSAPSVPEVGPSQGSVGTKAR